MVLLVPQCLSANGKSKKPVIVQPRKLDASVNLSICRHPGDIGSNASEEKDLPAQVKQQAGKERAFPSSTSLLEADGRCGPD